jgi:hypothetical protein
MFFSLHRIKDWQRVRGKRRCDRKITRLRTSIGPYAIINFGDNAGMLLTMQPIAAAEACDLVLGKSSSKHKFFAVYV